jgi:hypothetical protein
MIRIALIASVILASAPAFAGEQPPTAQRQANESARLPVTVCERDPLTQAHFRREHGSSPTFVTADDVLSAQAAGERWSEPRCIADRQHRELQERLDPR